MADEQINDDYGLGKYDRKILAGFDDRQRAIYDALERRDFAPLLDWEEPYQSSASGEAIAYLSQLFAAPAMFGGVALSAKRAKEAFRSIVAQSFPRQDDERPEYDTAVFEERNCALVACCMSELNALCGELSLAPYYDIDVEDADDVEEGMVDSARKSIKAAFEKYLKENR